MKECFAVWLSLPLALAAPACAWAEKADATKSTAAPVCDEITAAADRYRLPVSFFTKLIWQESRFRSLAVSPAGARGVAQFMPLTAADRGLADPFAQHDAILASAAFLDELRSMFGNLGLAAAAYNAGPGRLTRWRAGEGELPQETHDYVLAITGHTVEEWKASKPPALAEAPAFSCAHFAEIAARLPERHDAPAGQPGPPPKAWAVILVGNPRRDQVMSEYQTVKSRFFGILGGAQPSVRVRRLSGAMTPRYIVQIEHDTRAEANALCGKLLRAGGNCFVLANRS